MSTGTSWGRWGADDERGAANLVTPAVTLAALSEIRTGEALALGVPLHHNSGPTVAMRTPMQHYMRRDGGDYCAGLKEHGGLGFADDVIMLPTHAGTHIDALAHVWHEHAMYNGFSADTVTSRGAQRCGIDKVGPLVTRALFVDLVPPGALGLPQDTAIGVSDILARLDAGGVEPRPGDALLVRTGWLDMWKAGQATVEACAGLSPDTAEWIVDSGFALVGADNIAVEIMPSPAGQFLPLHIALIRNHGIYLMEVLDLEPLSRRGRSACALLVSPLPIVNGVGSPVSPVVIL